MKALVSYLVVSSLIIFMVVGCGSEETAEHPDPPETAEEVQEEVEEAEVAEEEEEEVVVVEREEAFSGGEFTSVNEDLFSAMQEDVRSLQAVEEAHVDGELTGYRILITPNGYGGPMEIFTYFDLEGTIIRVDVGEHGETVGIGSQVEEASYLINFDGVSSSEEVAAVDGMSGATYSSGAVKDGVIRALNTFSAHLHP